MTSHFRFFFKCERAKKWDSVNEITLFIQYKKRERRKRERQRGVRTRRGSKETDVKTKKKRYSEKRKLQQHKKHGNYIFPLLLV